jgi:hypothetical protein
MPSSRTRHRVTLVRTDVSEERIASIIRATRIGELVFLRRVLQLLVTANVHSSLILFILIMVLTTAMRHHIPENGILIVTAMKISALCVILVCC